MVQAGDEEGAERAFDALAEALIEVHDLNHELGDFERVDELERRFIDAILTF